MEITRDTIKNARTYLNIGAKQRLSEQIAGWVVQPVEMNQDDVFSIPPIYKENRALKNMLMMGILCKFYLQMEFDCDKIRFVDTEGNLIEEKPIDYYPTMEAFDDMASSAIMNQLERMKKCDKEIINTIFDFMYDYKTLEQMVNAEIKDYLAQKNDVISRAVNMLELLVSEKNLEKMQNTLTELQKELESYETEKDDA
ncbi:MAG: hypothetical protein IKG47_00150 [Oscillospiraceae bacterium]|nr:hypothetical protein [Clostridiales bacterium]MBR3353755.1 hypothetical protein [Oscillospiraceae bacterium]